MKTRSHHRLVGLILLPPFVAWARLALRRRPAVRRWSAVSLAAGEA